MDAKLVKEALAKRLAETGVSPSSFATLISARTLTCNLEKTAGFMDNLGTAGKVALALVLGLPWVVGLATGATADDLVSDYGKEDLQYYKDKALGDDYNKAIGAVNA